MFWVHDIGEFDRESTVLKFRIVQIERTHEVKRSGDHYNMDSVIAAGYRVNVYQITMRYLE